MSELIKLTLELFLYDLREGLGEEKDEIEGNQKKFLQKLPETVCESLKYPPSNVEIEYYELLPERIEIVPPPSSEVYKQLEMYYYPVHLGDSYGLLLNCSHLNDNDLQNVNSLAYLQSAIQEKLNSQEAALGKTWVISGSLPDAAKGKEEEIARKCYEYLMPDAKWDDNYEGEGSLLGGKIFELWEGDDPLALLQASPQKKHHVIIIVYPNRAIAKRAAEFIIYDWMRLFLYRSKILFAYGESRKNKSQLIEDFRKIKECVEAVSQENFKKPKMKKQKKTLDESQDTLSRYGIEVRYLDFQRRTIEINLQNYQKRLMKIEHNAKKEAAKKPFLPETDFPIELKFLAKFSTDTRDKYLLQVQKDYENLSPGLELLELLINSIRSVVEVEQAERDRTFQTLVGVFGVGLGAGSAAASLVGNFPHFDPAKDKRAALDNYWLDSFISKWLHVSDPWLVSATLGAYCLIITLIACAIAALTIKLWGRATRVKKRSP